MAVVRMDRRLRHYCFALQIEYRPDAMILWLHDFSLRPNQMTVQIFLPIPI